MIFTIPFLTKRVWLILAGVLFLVGLTLGCLLGSYIEGKKVAECHEELSVASKASAERIDSLNECRSSLDVITRAFGVGLKDGK